MERYGKINAMNSGSESWTGIGVVAGCAVVMLITQRPHVQDIATYWRIKLLHILQEVGSICKTRNHLLCYDGVKHAYGDLSPGKEDTRWTLWRWWIRSSPCCAGGDG